METLHASILPNLKLWDKQNLRCCVLVPFFTHKHKISCYLWDSLCSEWSLLTWSLCWDGLRTRADDGPQCRRGRHSETCGKHSAQAAELSPSKQTPWTVINAELTFQLSLSFFDGMTEAQRYSRDRLGLKRFWLLQDFLISFEIAVILFILRCWASFIF